MDGPRLKISKGMRRFLDYPKFQGTTRMLILETDYFFDRSWQRAASQLGWQVATVPSAMTGAVPMEHIKGLFTALGEFKPDFVITSNYAGMDTANLFARFFDDARIPYVSWFTDTPRMILFDREILPSHYAVAATWEKAYIPHFEQRGFRHVFHMPLATDPELFRGSFEPAPRRNVGFVGASMTHLVEEAWEKLSHWPDAVDAIHAAFDAGRITRNSYVEGLDSLLPASLLEGRSSAERRNVELAINYEGTRRQRVALVKALEAWDIEVRGDDAWRDITPNAGGALGYFDDLAPFYRDTAVNVNATSLQMKTAANQRVFDCPAAGGFLITDDQPGLVELFDPNTEVVTWQSLEELRDKTAYYLKRPTARARIVEAAQRRIHIQHTHRHRLEELGTYLHRLYG